MPRGMTERDGIVYFDCASGASGEMFLGALVDAGLLEADLRDVLAPLQRAGASFEISVRPVTKGPVAAAQVVILGQARDVQARLPDMVAVIGSAQLAGDVAARATDVLRRMATEEARLAGERPDDHVFAGTRGVDAIVGAVGVIGALASLRVGTVMASPVNVGRQPDPAAAALLAHAPTYEDSPGMPLVTPLGAALLAELVEEWPASPPFAGGRVGHGAGVRDLPKPNVMRCFLGYGTISGATQKTRPE
jgi:uncharacterized protein (DUF111 family)